MKGNIIEKSWFACLLLLLSCNYQIVKRPAVIGSHSSQVRTVGYSSISKALFVPNCVSCHGTKGDVNLETYENVVANIKAVQEAIDSGDMPPRGELSSEVKALLNEWIAAEMPRQEIEIGESSPPAAPDPVLEPTPLPPSTPPTSQELNVGYETIKSLILAPNCISCHGSRGGVNLESYENVKLNLAKVEEMVTAGDMPPRGALPTNLQGLLKLWIQQGAPQDPIPVAADPDLLTPIPTPKLEPTYASLNFHVFGAKCIACHAVNSDSEARRYPMQTKNQILSNKDFIDIRRPERSELVEVLRRRTASMLLRHGRGGRDQRDGGEDESMPPPSSGIAPVTSEEIDTIVQWIANGTPN